MICKLSTTNSTFHVLMTSQIQNAKVTCFIMFGPERWQERPNELPLDRVN